MSDDLLGQQQDDIAKHRYALAKAIESNEEFSGCQSWFDVYCRVLETHGQDRLRQTIADTINAAGPAFNPGPWLDQLVAAIHANDEAAYDLIKRKATIAGLF